MEKSARKFELGSSGYSYEGEITDQMMHGYGRLTLKNREFIEGRWDRNRLTELEFCMLRYRDVTFNMVKRCDGYLLTVFEQQFVATVTLSSTDLDFSGSTEKLKEAFFGKVAAKEILQDELRRRRQESVDELSSLLINMTNENSEPLNRANIFIILRQYCSESTNIQLRGFMSDRNAPPELKDVAEILWACDTQYCHFYNSFIFLGGKFAPLDLRCITTKIYRGGVEKHREVLISACPSALPSLTKELEKIDDSKIVYIRRADIDVFGQLTIQPFFQNYKDCVEILVKRFGHAFDKMPTYSHPAKIIPIISPVFEYLVRSFWEIISEIIEAADGYNYESMLKSELGKYWKIEDKIKWPLEQNSNAREPGIPRSSDKKSFYHRSLEVQYILIFEILKHMFPDNYIQNKRFGYKFHVLDSFEHDDGRKAEGSFPFDLQLFRKAEGLPARFKSLSEERLVWLYILDHTIHNVFKDHPKSLVKRCLPMLQGPIQFIENSPTENHESFRVLTHSTVKLVASASPYMRVSTKKRGDVNPEQEEHCKDVEILFQQILSASQGVDHDPLALSNFRDLITEYNKYLSHRHFIELEAAPGYFSEQLTHLMQTLMRIVETSLKKSVPTTAMVVYLRCLNDFLEDFRSIDFLGMWYIKTVGNVDEKAVEKVVNKLSAGKHCSYRVTDIERFVADYLFLGNPPPHHYIVQIATALLGCIKKCLNKKWQSNADQPLVQLKTTGVLLEAVRRSFMYLKEQPDYVDFMAFKKESVDPFVRLVEECSTLDELKHRGNILKESFWYLRKMDEIDIDQAMILLREVNTGSVPDELRSGYNLYLGCYNKYIEVYTSVLSDGKSHAEGLDIVRQMLRPVEKLHYSQWTEEFKTDELPILLAGLSAVWSILVSKDLSSTGRFLKPHCIQVLCILSLLGVGQPKGIDNHLAQVLTGQGKSVILGLLSSILALTGHKVRVLCYSKYLSSRDENDFWEFFDTFEITEEISYGTFEDMAIEFLHPKCNGRRTSLRQLVEDRVLYHRSWSRLVDTTESKNTVLLIDEVDAFFTPSFYGNTFNAGVPAEVDGLVEVQEKIWSLAKTKRLTENEIVDTTKEFIRTQVAVGDIHLSNLNTFLSKPGTFPLLVYEGENITVKNGYTNRTLFDEHLLAMVRTARIAAHHASTEYKINSDGHICKRSDTMYDEEWRCYVCYYNIFYYFRLKGSHYDHKNYINYGYLRLTCGRVSYSHLPSQFQLILGVSGTLKNLNDYEKSAIQSYNIHKNTLLPSFYGESNLLFNGGADFRYHTKEQDWLKDIYNQASRMIQLSRAVMAFFETDLQINLFLEEYKTKFDRLNEITTETEPNLRDRYIEEAGLPGAVTLATRSMGRGVDYKSSLSVERHGGVHVIQTFFSKDIKEQIQLQGRTARKDNKGSYEIIVCKAHLIKERIIAADDQTAHTYATLDEIRQNVSVEEGKTVTERIKRAERDHQTTMEYFGLA